MGRREPLLSARDRLAGRRPEGTFFLLLFAITYRLLARRQLFVAGAVFGLAAVKPQLMLVLLLVMLVQREWRFVAGLASTGVVLGVQSLIVGGPRSIGSRRCCTRGRTP